MARVAPVVAKIETAGGQDLAGATAAPGGRQAGVRKGVGPTTGLVVAADGYVISSSFNFANKPTDIFVTVPGHPRQVAKVVATDQTRMLTLLKVGLKDLPVPTPVPKAEFRVGQWALALGRALDTNPSDGDQLSVSVGIISALGRIYGKCVQTDAKVSPVNYGGPLAAIDGRVYGVLVPASPRGETDVAGVEWYDSGIGFAVPLEDVFAALPRLKAGEMLTRGMLGITAKVAEDTYNPKPVVGNVARDSAAEKAGVLAGDTVTAIDGKPVANFSQVQHALGPKYAGDAVAVKVLRDGKEVEFKNVKLTAAVTSFAAPFLGILPLRDDPTPGVELRYVYPKSAADGAGLKAGDRLMSVVPKGVPNARPAKLTDRDQLAGIVAALKVGTEVEFEVKRKGADKADKVSVTLAAADDALAPAAPLPSSAGKAGGAAKPVAKPKGGDKPKEKAEPERGLMERTNSTVGREYWLYVPPNYEPGVAHGVIVWLHRAKPAASEGEDLAKIFGRYCADHHFILVGPKSRNAEGWVPSDTEEVVADLRAVMGDYTVDRKRVVAHGMGVGGQMAFYLGFSARDLFRGVAVTGAVLGTQPKEPVPGQPLAFFVVAGEQDPLVKQIAEAPAKLREKKYPVVYRQIKDFGKEYLLDTTLQELMIWLDTLDKI
jgi:serine protease Do